MSDADIEAMIADLKFRATRFIRALEAAKNAGEFYGGLALDYVPGMRRELDEHLPAWAERVNLRVAEMSKFHDRKPK